MENLNKDPGLVKNGCGLRLFIWSRDAPLPSQVAHVKGRDRQQLLCAPSEGCVLFHINDKERSGSKKSLSYTHLFKKSQPHNTVGRSPQESVKAGGCVNDKRQKQPHFLSLKQGLPNFRLPLVFHQNQEYLHAFQWGYSCIKKEALLHSTVISLLLLSLSF